MASMRSDKNWLVTHIPDSFSLTCPEDFDEDRFLTEVLMTVNLAEHKYQICELLETIAHSFISYVGSDDVTGEEEERGWELAEWALQDATQLFDYVKPALRYLEKPEGFGVDINDPYLDASGLMFVVEEI